MNLKKKISLYFLLCIVAFSYSQSKDNTITISFNNIPLSEAIQRIEKVCSYTFFYDALKIDLKQKVSLNANKTPIKKAITDLLANTTINFEITNSQIAIFQIKKNDEPQITKKTKIVSGVVLDEKGQPVIGASVIIPGTTIGVATDINGRFTLEAPSNAKLRISYIGYDAKEELLNSSNDLKIKLEPTPQALKELVITAQAIGQKNAILQQINSNTIKNVVAADRLQENPDANSVEALGRLPGISVQRSGGEGVGLVIRGLEPRYTSVMLNGIQLPSTSGSDRGTNLSGISQYALQGAEVFKSLTADMEANSVAGTVNLKLRQAPPKLHMNIMAQKGYNDLNKYWGNYKLLGEFSNRFFDNKLGVLFTANAEKVTRSIQAMSAGYGIESSDPNGDILLSGISLNNNETFIYRRSAMLSLDYKVSDNTTLMLYGMYNNSKTDRQNQIKRYSVTGAGGVTYAFSSSPNAQNNIFQTALSGETKFKLLNMKADYGVSYSSGQNYNLGARSWNFTYDNASSSAITVIDNRKLHPAEIVPLFTDNQDKLLDCRMNSFGMSDSKINDKNINVYLNFTVPFKVGSSISGNVKFGGSYRNKNRVRDDLVGTQVADGTANVSLPKIISDSLDWIVRSSNGHITADGLADGKIDNFLNGQFNFGNTFNIDRLNQISDMWEKTSDYYYNQGPAVYLPVFGQINKLGYTQNVAGCMMNDQDIKENYSAGYIMTDINFGKYVMFLPGVRLENTNAKMNGFYAMPLQYSPPISAALPGSDTSAVRSDQFILPMIHLRIKPTSNFYMHFAYTQTLSRPDFNVITPNYYVSTGEDFQYSSNNPTIKPEQWTNLDAQFVLHGKKMGLFSVNLFYKTVKDKIWYRNYTRIKGDPIIDPFPNTAVVDVSIWENHSYKGFVRGVEVDWQTSFYFLPKPFNYLTLSANYTFTNSETNYPYQRFALVTPVGGGRPISVRIDSTTTGPMTNQPTHIANVSLGFNKNGFNAWLSFQYNGGIYTSKNLKATPRLDAFKDYFYRWDLQLTQKFAIKTLAGFEVLLNIANISNFTESQHYAGDLRPTSREQYGWTTDLGLRFKF